LLITPRMAVRRRNNKGDSMKYLTMVLVIIVTFTLSACGKNGGGTASSSPLQLTKPANIENN